MAVVAVLAALPLWAGCERQATPKMVAPIQSAKRPAVAQEVFLPPSDGRLSERQGRIYLEVRADLSSRGVLGPEEERAEAVRIAGEKGVSPAEYAWVHERVREALNANFQGNMARVQQQMLGQQLLLLQRQMEGAEPEKRKDLEEQLRAIQDAQGEVTRESGGTQSAAAYNRDLLRGLRQERETPDTGQGDQDTPSEASEGDASP